MFAGQNLIGGFARCCYVKANRTNQRAASTEICRICTGFVFVFVFVLVFIFALAIMDKYIFQFRQNRPKSCIHWDYLAGLNLDLHRIRVCICICICICVSFIVSTVNCWSQFGFALDFTIQANTIFNMDKYIQQFRQIHFAIQTNTNQSCFRWKLLVGLNLDLHRIESTPCQ